VRRFDPAAGGQVGGEHPDADVTDEQTIPPQTGQAGQPDSPLELSAPDWKESLRRAIREFKTDRGALVSAGMAFYWFLAIFPALLAAVGFIGLVNASPQFIRDMQEAIRSTLPGSGARVLTDALDQTTRGSGDGSLGAALLGTGLALWSASAGFVALQAGLDVAYDVEEERTFVQKRLRAFLLIVVSAVLGGIATVLIVFGQPLGETLRDNLPFGGAFVLVWTLLRWVLGLAALSTLFAAYYYLGPNRGTPRWTWLSPGGVLATIIWLLASLGFSFYVTSFASYAETYGSFTGVVVLMLWLFLSAIAVMVGGELNAELERQGEFRRRRDRRGGGARPSPQASPTPTPTPAPVAQAPPARQPAAARAGSEPAPPPPSDGDSYEDEWLASMRRLRDKN
jgi:membrane protein